jgi:dipeptidyl aminopeptidase/acylaminoacyl peptidase
MTRWQRTWLLNVDAPGEAARKIWDRSEQDRYGNPGNPVTKTLPNGKRIVLQNGSTIYLIGTGSSPEGDRPFLDQLDLVSLQSKRLYRCAETTYESVIALLDENASKFLTRYESPTEPPNVLMRSADGSSMRALTWLTDPTPQLRKIRKQLVTYKRPDGVALSFELYLPPDYREGARLPTVVWAYPLEYTDARTASQVTGSPYRFTMIDGMSHLFFLTQGYAVLDNAARPVVGDSETVNNTYVEQIVADAKAAIDKAVELGVTDSDRVGVGGHSYGAFMTANLLSHCSLFKAGIARSGAYNRTLTPFGFQSEIRTIWEAPELYMKVSPFLYADKIKAPILLIHGEADNNSGTFPIQSERYYHALKGNGKTVRYVSLPLESHGYQARESIEHTLYEMISWFDRYVKNVTPANP